MSSLEEKNKILEKAAKEINADPDNLVAVLKKFQNEIIGFDTEIKKLRKS